MTRRAQISFAGFFLTVVFIPPLVQACFEVAQGRSPQFFELFTGIPTRSRLRSWEHDVQENSLTVKASRPVVQSVWFRLLHYAGEKVVPGLDSWLFYKPDVRYLVEPAVADAEHQDPYPAIIDFHKELARQGIHLIVLPMPGKPSVYPEKLTGHVSAGKLKSHTLDLIRRLQMAGVETIDLFTVFQYVRQFPSAQLYLRLDTHWSPQAAEMAAKIAAERILAMPIDKGNEHYQVRNIEVRRVGDIVKMIQIPYVETIYPRETLRCSQVIGYKDDPSSPVLILGDSFFRIYQTDEPKASGFIAHLARALQMPVASIVNDGGASTLVRQELARQHEILRGKKVVLWEFVERDIRFGNQGWKIVPVPVYDTLP